MSVEGSSIDQSEDDRGLEVKPTLGVDNSRSPTESSLEHSSLKEENEFGSSTRSAHETEERAPATVGDIKNTGNLIYKHIVCMIDFLMLKYRELKNPSKDPVAFKKFIFFKQDVIVQTGLLISQLEEFQDPQLWLLAQDFIFTTYELHQYLIQLVIDKQKLSTETTIELQRGEVSFFWINYSALTILYKQSLLFIRALDHIEQQQYYQDPNMMDPNMMDPNMVDPNINPNMNPSMMDPNAEVV